MVTLIGVGILLSISRFATEDYGRVTETRRSKVTRR
jgi:hypothetical protein